jgi:rare lipoprotein A
MILAGGILCATAGAQANSPAPPAAKAVNSPSQTIQNKAVKHRSRFPVIGRASWYGPHFQGKKTANGEIYNMYDLTAASKTLPLGSYAKVTNLRNHRWILVRINDRGPMVDGRILDLSYASAEALHLVKAGVETVKIQPLSSDSVATVAMLDTP